MWVRVVFLWFYLLTLHATAFCLYGCGALNLINFFWQDELLPMVHSKNLTLSFSSESSIEEELKRESTADAITISVRPWFASNWWWRLLPWYFPFSMTLVFGKWKFLIASHLMLFQISYLVMFAYISLTLGDLARFNSFYISSKVCSIRGLTPLFIISIFMSWFIPLSILAFIN